MRASKRLLEPTIRTKRLTLRPLAERDLADLANAINDPAVARMLAVVPAPYSRRDAEIYLAASRKLVAADRLLALIIEYDGRLVGNLGLGAMPYACEFGYWLSRACWGYGFATEAARAFLAYAFDVLAIPLVRSGVFVDNPASLRVQDKLGFRRVGIGRKRSLARGGEVAHIDTVLTRARFHAVVARERRR